MSLQEYSEYEEMKKPNFPSNIQEELKKLGFSRARFVRETEDKFIFEGVPDKLKVGNNNTYLYPVFVIKEKWSNSVYIQTANEEGEKHKLFYQEKEENATQNDTKTVFMKFR